MPKPTKPGYYWYLSNYEWVPVEVYDSNDGLRVGFPGLDDMWHVSSLTGEWGSEIVHA